jgi:hypothetical protein
MNKIPASTLLKDPLYRKAVKTNQPSVLSNIANNTKRFFRFTVDIIERAVRRILGKDTTGPSSIQKAISIRTISAKDMLNNASLPLNGNKNLRAHRANLDDMLEIYPDATAVALYSPDNNHLESTSISYNKLSKDKQDRCTFCHIPSALKSTPELTTSNIVDCMMSDIEARNKELFENEEIKIIIEEPLFMVSKQNNSFTNKDCIKKYITACEAWQLHLQKKYNKKVTILSFRAPEDINNENYAQFTQDSNNAYDNANAELARINKKDKLITLISYIYNNIQRDESLLDTTNYDNTLVLNFTATDDNLKDNNSKNSPSLGDNKDSIHPHIQNSQN